MMSDMHEAPPKPGIAARFLIAMLLVPMGIMLRVLAQIYLEITREAVHYWGLMGVVTIGHLALICLTLMALLTYRHKPLVVIAAVRLWIGYGIGAALLILKDM
jgi:hypothetical protein